MIALAAAGCAADVGAAQPWIPVDEVQPPLQVDASPAGAAGKAMPAAQPASLRVVTYNVDEEDPDMTPEQLAAAILGDADLASASVFLLQEEESHPWEPTSRSAQLADLLGTSYVYVPARMKGTSTHGLAILSVYPIENVEKMDLPATRGRARIAVAADIVVGEHVLHVITVHLEPTLNSSERLAQLRPAVIDAPAQVLLAGDFNMNWLQFVATGVPVLSATSASDQSAAVDSYLRALGFAVASAGSGTTAHATGYEARLDGIYGRGLAVRFGRVERVGPSDHWPLWADVTVP
jgi:endonuclease/exonuclease/phosphatase family metal-dependent hydrolase